MRLACVGAGHWGRNLVRNFHHLGVLALICEADLTRLEQLSGEYPNVRSTISVDEILGDQDVTAVAIATPAETHGDLVRRALLAGKDVFVEKPLCLSVDEGEELVKLAEKSERVLMVGHLLRYHPAVLKLKELIDSGELGRIQYVYSNRLNLGKIRREENILWSFAPHDVSVILDLLGEMPERVQSQGGSYLQERIADVTVTLLTFGSGVKAHVFVSWLHPFKEQKLVVVGSRKMAVFDDLEPKEKLVLFPHAINWRQHLPVASRAEAEPVSVETIEPLRAECAHFIDCVERRLTPRTDGREAVRVLQVLEACEKALRGDGRAVSVKESASPERPYFVHESAYVDQGAEIGDGTTIWHFSHVLRESKIGKNCRIGQNVVIGPKVTVGNGVKIQNNVSVYEGVTLEDDVFCGPSMVFTNVYNPRSEIRRMDELRPTHVQHGASLGANCTIMCGTVIGRYAFVGAGAVVLKDVPDFALVVGNPGRIIGWMCVCGNRVDFDDGDDHGSCVACRRRYRKEDHKVIAV